MVLSREEKEKMVLDLYYNRGYTYKQLTRELRMSPNQIREIIKRYVSRLWKLYKELVINRGMSIEAVANVVDIALNRLPRMESILEETIKAVARKQVDFEYLEKRIHFLEEEEKRRRGRMIT